MNLGERLPTISLLLSCVIEEAVAEEVVALPNR